MLFHKFINKRKVFDICTAGAASRVRAGRLYCQKNRERYTNARVIFFSNDQQVGVNSPCNGVNLRTRKAKIKAKRLSNYDLYYKKL